MSESCNGNEWGELATLQSKSYDITTYDVDAPNKIRAVPYPLDERTNKPVLPQCIWAYITNHDMPKLFCFHGEEASTWVSKGDDQSKKAFANCYRRFRPCSYFVSFTQIYGNLQKDWKVKTKVYPRKSQHVDDSASQTAVESVDSSCAPPTPQSPFKRFGIVRHQETVDRAQKRMRMESLASKEYDSSPYSPLVVKQTPVRQEDVALLSSGPVASGSGKMQTESKADRARRRFNHMLSGGGLSEEEFEANFAFKRCGDCSMIYYGNFVDACPCNAARS